MAMQLNMQKSRQNNEFWSVPLNNWTGNKPFRIASSHRKFPGKMKKFL